MRVYIWVQQGRLGNLIFQYQAIHELAKKCDLIFCLDNEVFKTIKVDRNIIRAPLPSLSKCKFLSKLCVHFWGALFEFLSRVRILSGITAKEVLIRSYVSETRKLILKRGLFSSVVVVHGFFQHDGNFLHPVVFQDEIRKMATTRLNLLTSNKVRVGVHIRTTDYEKWSIMGKQGLVLPQEWYQKAVNLIRSRILDASFVIFTDNPSAAKLLLGSEKHFFYRGDSDLEDLVAMALCDHLIISPSSFSLAAGLSTYRPGKIIIAPKYWLGFKSRKWFPVDISSNKLEYLDVDCFE